MDLDGNGSLRGGLLELDCNGTPGAADSLCLPFPEGLAWIEAQVTQLRTRMVSITLVSMFPLVQ